MNHFINTAASDLSRARTVGLNQLTPEPFPVLVVGTRSNHQFFFANRGTLETWSGSTDYRMRVTVGDCYAGPIGATFSLTVDGEDPVTIGFDCTAAGLQNILNDIATVGTDDGGVDVISQGFGRFLIGYRELGVPTDITTDGALLLPDCEAVLNVLTAGSSTTRQLLSLTLTRTTPAQVTAWNTITSPYAGWSGVIQLDSAAALELIRVNGVERNGSIECQTLLTVEVIDNNANAFAYFQAPITLRALNYMQTITTLPVGPTSNAQTNASGDTTVAPTSQIHTETITISGAASVRNILVSSTNLVAGARIDLVLLFTGANGQQVKVYANTTGGTLLFDFTRAGDEANALFVLYADGLGSFKDKLATIPAFG